MMIIIGLLFFLLGVMVTKCITEHKICELMQHLNKVSDTGDEMWQCGVIYAVEQIDKML